METPEDGESDGLFRLSPRIGVVTLDSMNESLYNWGFGSIEGEVSICMHRSDVTEVLLDCLGLDSASYVLSPGHDCRLGCWEENAVGIEVVVELAEVNEGLLTCVVGRPGTGRDAMPKVKCDGW